jgi:hypothetical protein
MLQELLKTLGLPQWKIDFSLKLWGDDTQKVLSGIADDLCRNAIQTGESLSPIFELFRKIGHPLNEEKIKAIPSPKEAAL